MIGQFISLYKARQDPTLAKRIASEMAVDGVVDRASWPLAIAKIWMSAGLIAMVALAMLFLALGSVSHWAVATPVLPLGIVIYGIMKLWRGINAGVERVTQVAKLELGNRAAAISFRSRPSETDLTTEN